MTRPALQGAFSLTPTLTYLNHAAVAPWPDAAHRAVVDFAAENTTLGARDYPRWLARQNRLRKRLARLIGAASGDDIALVANTSEGLSMVAFGLDWQPGDNIVSFANEFPSNRIVWQALQSKGVELRLASLNIDGDPEADLLSLVDRNTRLIAVSSVQFHNGFRVDLERIGAHCQKHDILFCIDAIQSLGALRFDVHAVHADFVAADGHKWLLGPEGLGLFWVRPELRERLTLHRYGWHMIAHPHDFSATEWSPADNARRFEPGSPNLLSAYALDASVGLLLDVGIDNIEQQLLANSRHIIERVKAEPDWKLMSSASPNRLSGSVSFAIPGQDHEALWKKLLENQVVCAPRGGGLRLSPHAYQGNEDIDRAFDAIHSILKFT